MTRWRGGLLVVLLLVLAVTAPAVHSETPVPAKADAGAADPSVPFILVRAGEHRGYTRIVFDWREAVDYQVDHEGNHVRVVFSRQARFDLSRLPPQPGRWIKTIMTASTAQGALVRLGVDEGARLRHLRVGPKVVVDVFATHRPRGRPTEKAAPGPGETAEPAASADSVKDQSVDLKTAALADSDTPATEPDTAPADAVPADAETARDAVPSAGASRDDSARRPERKRESTTRRAPETAEEAWEALRFAWREPTAAAVFQRAGWIWIVFDRPFEKPVFEPPHADGSAIRQLPHDRATILRLAATHGLDPVVERDGFTWTIRPVPSPATLAEPIVPEVQADPPSEARLLLAAEGLGALLAVKDPEIGDELMIVPLMPPGRGVAHAYGYPQFGLLQTAQGIVIVPRADDLQVSSVDDGIAITHSAGLHVSPVPEAVRDRAQLRSSEPLTRVFPALSWPEALSGDAYVARERQLRHSVALASEADRHTILLDVARFYLAHGLFAECLGALAQIADDRRDVQEMAEFRLLRGACRLLMGRSHEAAIDLSHPSLDGIDEGGLWRAAREAMFSNPETAAVELSRTGSIALDYPDALRAPLTRLAVEATLAAGNERAAKSYLDVLRSEPRSGVSIGHLAFLEGELRELEGDHDAALVKWAEAEQSNDRPSRARAAFARIQAQRERDELDHGEAIAALETLRYAWRGDDFEFALLRELAELYGESGDHRKQLTTLRQAATNFPQHPQVAEVAAEMTAVFESLYLEGGADTLTPLSAIALFDEFRELTPVGEKGNEMIRKLADRLVGVDLLDRAARLLEDQIHHRLQGPDQARIGARLALVYLLDQKPEQALQALKASATADMPATPDMADLTRQRRHLEARALADLQRTEEALLLLGNDDSMDADLIRADVFWKIRDWKQADEVLARLARHAGARPGQPLEGNQARYVLNRAVALTLGADEDELARLRQDYGAAMEMSPYADAFRLIASARIERATDIRALISTGVREAEGFQAFLAAYRDRLRQQSLSAIN